MLFEIFTVIILLFALLILFWQGSLLYVALWTAPTVYAHNQAIFDSLSLAGLKKGELVVDLGCGNARSLILAAKKFSAKGVGVEISPYCYLKAKFNVFLAGENHSIRILFGDFVKAEKYLKKADVVYLYLLNATLKKIEPWYFKSIGKKTRTVILSFGFVIHKPKKETPTFNLGKKTKAYLY